MFRIVLALAMVVCGLNLPCAAAANESKLVVSVTMPCASQFQSISPTGEVAALYCTDDSVILVNISSHATVHRFAPERRVGASDYSRDGRWFAALEPEGTVEIVSTVGSGKEAEPQQFKLTGAIRDIDFLPDGGGLLVLPYDEPAQIWDTRGNPKQVATLRNDFGGLIGFAFSPDGKLLVTADGDTIIRVYDTADWRLVHEYRGLMLETFAVEFTPDGKHVFLGGPDEHIVELNTDGTEARRIEKDPAIPFTMLSFGSSGQVLILYVDGEGRAKAYRAVWNAATGKSAPLAFDRPVTGSRVVHGQLWLASAKDKQLEIFEYLLPLR